MLLNSPEVQRREKLLAVVTEFPVDLIYKQEEAVFPAQFGQAFQGLPGVETACRVIGVGNENTFGIGSDRLLKCCGIRQLEAIVY